MPEGRARERRGTRARGRVGTRRVGDRLESRRHGGGATGGRLHWATLELTPGGRRGVRGALRGESPRTREGRRPDRPREFRKAYCSTLPVNGAWTGHDAIAPRGIGTRAPILDCTPAPSASQNGEDFDLDRFGEAVAGGVRVSALVREMDERSTSVCESAVEKKSGQRGGWGAGNSGVCRPRNPLHFPKRQPEIRLENQGNSPEKPV